MPQVKRLPTAKGNGISDEEDTLLEMISLIEIMRNVIKRNYIVGSNNATTTTVPIIQSSNHFFSFVQIRNCPSLASNILWFEIPFCIQTFA